jgi:hypothetical protein
MSQLLIAFPQSEIVSPVTVEEFAEALDVEDTYPGLAGILIQATGALINYLRLDMLERPWKGEYKQPLARAGLSRTRVLPLNIELPYTGPATVTKVTGDGSELDSADYSVSGQNPVVVSLGSNFQHVEIEYTAGYTEVPEIYKAAIIRLGEIIFDNRGCSLAKLIEMSGVAQMLGDRVEYSL